MSHFTVLVIGDHVEKQLAPFHEFECTGRNDEFVQYIDVTAEVQARIDNGESIEDALGWYGMEERVVSSEDQVDKTGDGKHKYGYAVITDGKLVKAIDRTNPNKKWDWFLIGGRWAGYFKLKPGCEGACGKPGLMTPPAEAGYVDSAKKGDIDIDAMRDEAGQKAAASWDKANAIIGDKLEGFIPWKTMRDEVWPEDQRDAARDAYHAQPAVAALGQAGDFGIFASVEKYAVPRDQYIQAARDSAITTFAVIKDSKWHERGSMGWWGAVSDEKDLDEWNKQFSDLVDGLPDDTLLTVVDCHI